jgi:hypothetical protein
MLKKRRRPWDHASWTTLLEVLDRHQKAIKRCNEIVERAKESNKINDLENTEFRSRYHHLEVYEIHSSLRDRPALNLVELSYKAAAVRKMLQGDYDLGDGLAHSLCCDVVRLIENGYPALPLNVDACPVLETPDTFPRLNLRSDLNPKSYSRCKKSLAGLKRSVAASA